MPLPAIPALVGAFLPAIGTVLDRLIPDKNARENAELQMKLALHEAAQQADLSQIEINKVEAAHASIFVAGWRPAIGWVCAGCIALYFGLQILVGMALWVWSSIQAGHMVERPELGMFEIFSLTAVLLGNATLRSREKGLGVAREKL
jgi:hypothetical protein